MAFTQLSSLDYQDIKVALREYLRNNSEFTDYDFEASSLSTILDLLAYNTYYTAFNTTMAVNEVFLDSASLRDNVVKIAKQLGYTPKSITSSTAEVSLKVDFSSVAAIDPREVPRFITLKKGNCCLTSNVENRSETYQFAILDDVIIPVVNNIANITNNDSGTLSVKEGVYVKYQFVVNNSSVPSQRFIIPTENVDTSTLRVYVKEDSSSTDIKKYEIADNILNVSADDRVFFVQEVNDQRYELIFGDGIVGKKLEDGQIVEAYYLVSSGSLGNNLKKFIFSGEIYDNDNKRILNNIIVSTVTPSIGGNTAESVSQIKFNAPKFYSSQNRAVTLDDYKIIVQKIYPSISDIIVFGGEEESPPEYGRVKITVKPSYTDFLSTTAKLSIIKELKKFNVASITPVIIDPSIIEVILESKVYYNSVETNLSSEEVKNLIINNLESYRSVNNISRFNGSVRKSKITAVIDSSENSIRSNQTDIFLRKKINPAINTKAEYLICFENALDPKCRTSTLTSTSFRTSEYPLQDSYFENIEDGTVRIYTIDPVTTQKIILFDNIGTLNFSEGKLNIDLVNIISGSNDSDEIFVRVSPLYDDINAVREIYLDLSIENSTFQIIPDNR
jgi:hypothetical protein